MIVFSLTQVPLISIIELITYFTNKMYQGYKIKRPINPRETANIFSWLSFFYTIKLFKKGFKTTLQQTDLYEVLTKCRAKSLGDELERHWEVEKGKKSPSIFRAIWACYGKTFLMFGAVQVVINTMVVITTPEALSKLVSYFTPGQTQITKTDAYYYAAIVIGFNFINFIYSHNNLIMIVELGIRARTAVCSLIYRKALKVNNSALSEISVGKITTILTKDIDVLELVLEFGNDIWIGTLQAIIIWYLIYNKIGAAAFSGIGFFCLILPIQIFIGKMSFFYRLASSKQTDKRVQTTRETLSAIKIIKMYTWERFFGQKICDARTEELRVLHYLFYTKVLILIIGNLCSKISFFLIIMSSIMLDINITAEMVYFLINCFTKLQNMTSYLVPYTLSQVAELYATFLRIESILLYEELPEPEGNCELTISPKIIFDNVTTTINEIDVLKNISLTIESGLNIVAGHIGSGKTTFLKTILEDVSKLGKLTKCGRISYASQEPWLFPSSVKNNILFGEEFDQRHYRKVLDVCSLNYDLDLLPDGDETIVGDRGINLSKGQQARVNLARAIYKDCDIYLLDDCLSALDASVSDDIFLHCLKEFLKNKLVIFVTHNSAHIRQADNVIIINQGEIKSCVKPENLDANFLKTQQTQKSLHDVIEPKSQTKHKQIYHETKRSGKVDRRIYWKYIRFGGGFFIFSLLIVFFLIIQSIFNYTDKLVSNWVTMEQNFSVYKVNNFTNSKEYKQMSVERSKIFTIYTIMIIISMILTIITGLSLFQFCRRASINLHKLMVFKITHATMQFFDTHFIGNILNRFSKDLFSTDEFLPFSISECMEMVFVIFGAIILLTTVATLFLLQSLIFFVIAYMIKIFYQPTGRNLCRMNASVMSPLIGHINSTLEGLTTIRAHKAQGIIKDEFDRHQDLYNSANYTLNSCMVALGFVLELLGIVFTAVVIIRCLTAPDGITVGDMGMVITQAFVITSVIQSGVKNIAHFENQMTSVERVLEFTEFDQEDGTGKETDDDWPEKPSIQFENVSLMYNYGPTLRNINFEIKPRQKIGIVGRTGAGKTSIISALFRLYKTEGRILIGDTDIQDLRLEFLRSRIAIIPQDPFLFSGTIRSNIDPLNNYSDEEIWKAIETVKLKNIIDDLNKTIDYASNFSVGQKQLICLARAIIRKNKIVILDEATANMDQETDCLIRNIIDEKFIHCTVITIAHRLISILNSHKVLVIHEGQVVEFDNPKTLLKNVNSFFYKMVKQF